jgi:hypothetical protein
MRAVRRGPTRVSANCFPWRGRIVYPPPDGNGGETFPTPERE